MGQAVSRTTDIGAGICPDHLGSQDYNTVFISSNDNVDANGLPVVTINDIGICSCGHPTVALSGSGIHDVNSKAVHRVSDTGANSGAYISLSGSPTVDSN